MLALGGFMHLESRREHLILLSAVAVLLGLLLFVVYWLDHPFGNQLGRRFRSLRAIIERFSTSSTGADQQCLSPARLARNLSSTASDVS